MYALLSTKQQMLDTIFVQLMYRKDSILINPLPFPVFEYSMASYPLRNSHSCEFINIIMYIILVSYLLSTITIPQSHSYCR